MSLVSRAIEARGQLQNPDRWFLRHLFGTETASGVQVNDEEALTSSAVLMAVRRIAGDLGATPLKVYQKKDRFRKRIPEHPVDQLFSYAPNREQTPFEFVEMLTGFYLLGGNAYAEIVRNGAGEVAELWPIPPSRIAPFRTKTKKTLAYVLALPDGGKDVLAPEQVLHIRGLSRDGILGLDIVNKMKESIGLSLALEEFSARFFKGGTNLSGLLQHPTKLKDSKALDRLQSDWNAIHSGLRNMHRVAILEEGMEWVSTGSDPEKTQLLDSRKFGVTEASRYFLIPPHLVGDMEKATYSNVEQQFLEYLALTLRHHFVRWQQTTKLKLLLPSEVERGIYTRFNTSSVLMATTSDRYEAHVKGINNGFLSPNDVRDIEDMNPYPGGDVYLAPINLGPVSEVGEGDAGEDGGGDDDDGESSRDAGSGGDGEILPPPGARPSWFELRATTKQSLRTRLRLRETYRILLEEAAAKWVNREARQIRRLLAALRKESGTIVAFETGLEGFLKGELEPYIVRTLLPSLNVFGSEIYREASKEAGKKEEELEPGARFDTFIQGYAENVAKGHTAATRNQLSSIAAESETGTTAELADLFEERVEEWTQKRAAKFGNRHKVEAEGAVSRLAYTLAGVLTLTWVALGENCPLCDELDGRSVSIGAPFLKKGEVVDEEGADPLTVRRSTNNPPLHLGCDCGITIG